MLTPPLPILCVHVKHQNVVCFNACIFHVTCMQHVSQIHACYMKHACYMLVDTIQPARDMCQSFHQNYAMIHEQDFV